MTRLILCAIFAVFFPNLAPAQVAKCGFDDVLRMVSCDQESRSVFQFGIDYPDVGTLSKLNSSKDKKAAGGDRERCRVFVEGFRTQKVEQKFNASLEKLRVQAESIRSASEDNLVLYKQIMLVYDALFGRYKDCVQAYQDVVKTCYITPYEVRPDRI